MTRITTFILFPLFLLCVLPAKIKSQTIQNKKAAVKTVPGAIEFTIGNLKGPRINVDSFKAQTIIKMTDDRFSFESASVYFSGGHSSDVIAATLNGNSLTGLAKFINRCQAGSIITFENIKVLGPDGVRVIEPRSFILYSGNYDTTQVATSAGNKEEYQLMKKGFVSGTIYFSGANFTNVVIVYINKATSLKNLIDRCGPGSVIALENCIYTNADGTLSKAITKTIKLD